jgi:hypothetical protein
MVVFHLGVEHGSRTCSTIDGRHCHIDFGFSGDFCSPAKISVTTAPFCVRGWSHWTQKRIRIQGGENLAGNIVEDPKIQASPFDSSPFTITTTIHHIIEVDVDLIT